MMTGSGPTGFEAQFQEFMFYAGSTAQLAYYIVLPIAAIWAVLLFKRMVDARTGRSANSADAGADAGAGVLPVERDADPYAVTDQPIEVEKFVE